MLDARDSRRSGTSSLISVVQAEIPTPIQRPRQAAATSASGVPRRQREHDDADVVDPERGEADDHAVARRVPLRPDERADDHAGGHRAEDRAVRADAAVVVRLHDARQQRGERRHRDHQDHRRRRDPRPDPRLARARSAGRRRARGAGRAPGRARTRAGARARVPPRRRRTTRRRSPRRATGRTVW